MAFSHVSYGTGNGVELQRDCRRTMQGRMRTTRISTLGLGTRFWRPFWDSYRLADSFWMGYGCLGRRVTGHGCFKSSSKLASHALAHIFFRNIPRVHHHRRDRRALPGASRVGLSGSLSTSFEHHHCKAAGDPLPITGQLLTNRAQNGPSGKAVPRAKEFQGRR